MNHLQKANSNGSLKVVSIGGGTGLSTLLAGLKSFVGPKAEEPWIESLSAIVTVSDDGGSSGRLREELQMLPPGDIRNCMIALSEIQRVLSPSVIDFAAQVIWAARFGNLFWQR